MCTITPFLSRRPTSSSNCRSSRLTTVNGRADKAVRKVILRFHGCRLRKRWPLGSDNASSASLSLRNLVFHPYFIILCFPSASTRLLYFFSSFFFFFYLYFFLFFFFFFFVIIITLAFFFFLHSEASPTLARPPPPCVDVMEFVTLYDKTPRWAVSG